MHLDKEISGFFLEEFGVALEKTRLEKYSAQEWRSFCEERKLKQAEGAYTIRNLTAHVLEDTEFAIPNYFHEYFGHGLFIEHSIEGKKLYNLEQKLMKEEKGLKSESEIIEFRKSSRTYEELQKQHNANLMLYEGFAMWIECLLSNMTGNLSIFEKKMSAMPKGQQELCMQFASYSKRFGAHGLFWKSGMPKHYTEQKLEAVLKEVFRADFERIELAVVYGSRKPYSDIDIFVVSDRIQCSFLGWLDVYAVSNATFNELLGKLDISITDALFSGSFVAGKKELFETARSSAINSEITPEIIQYHREHSEKAGKLASKFKRETEEHGNAMRYKASYLANANELEKGKKPLTLKSLMADYPMLKKNY